MLTRLTELKDVQAKDDYSANAHLRQGMRARKRKHREKEEESKVPVKAKTVDGVMFFIL